MLLKIDHHPVYLFGSMHFLPRNEVLPDRVFDVAFAADRVYFESDLDFPKALSSPSHYPKGDSLGRHIPPPVLKRVSTLARELSIDARRMKPWWVVVEFSLALVKQALGSEHKSADRELWDKLAERGKPRLSLEETDLSILFGNVPLKETLAQLDYIAANPARVGENFWRRHAAWSCGDLDAFAAEGEIENRLFPIVTERVYGERNRFWLPTILEAVRGGTPALFCVGAGHVAGPKDLRGLLLEAGLSTKLLTLNGG